VLCELQIITQSLGQTNNKDSWTYIWRNSNYFSKRADIWLMKSLDIAAIYTNYFWRSEKKLIKNNKIYYFWWIEKNHKNNKILFPVVFHQKYFFIFGSFYYPSKISLIFSIYFLVAEVPLKISDMSFKNKLISVWKPYLRQFFAIESWSNSYSDTWISIRTPLTFDPKK
jgi:hypothetical protein